MLWTIIALILSYLIGSIPTAYLFGRVFKGIDIRSHGSGNVGATNALRVLGKRVGITVLFLDILKGTLAVLAADLFAKRSGIDPVLLRVLTGIACVCGHNWTVFLRFRGGKGIATTLGVLIGLAFKVPGLAAALAFDILTWLSVFLVWRYVSLASVIAALCLPLYVFWSAQPRVIMIASILLTFFVIIRHKPNIIRLIGGKESKIKFTKQGG